MKIYLALVLNFISFSVVYCMPSYSYKLNWGPPGESTYYVSLTIEKAPGSTTRFKIPAWRPGRYILQNFAAAISRFSASDSKGKKLDYKKVDKDTWEVTNPDGKEITVYYHYYAAKIDAGSSFVGQEIAYFNPSNLFMYIEGGYDYPCVLEIPDLPSNWKIASGLSKTNFRNILTASSYHQFIDCPTILSPNLVQFEFNVDELKCFIHFEGNYQVPKGGELSFINNVSKIIKEQKAIFGEIPEIKEYHFIYLLTSSRIRHAVEHTNSSMYVMPDQTAKDENALNGLLSITSHEFWHVWNVKAVRPAALWPYDYSKECYTNLHWFTEGVTDYYTSLILVRAGLMTRENYIAKLAQLITSLESNYAQYEVSCEESSFNSWLATSIYAHPELSISYYELGSRAGWLLDLELRRLTNNQASLDHVFQYLYKEYYKKGKGVPEEGIQIAAEAVSGQKMEGFFKAYIRGVAPFDYEKVLLPLGLKISKTEFSTINNLNRLGAESVEPTDKGLMIKEITFKGDLIKAGLVVGDIIKSVNGKSIEDFNQLKLNKGQEFSLLIIRNSNEFTAKVKFTDSHLFYSYSLEVLPLSSNTFLESWLGSKVKK